MAIKKWCQHLISATLKIVAVPPAQEGDSPQPDGNQSVRTIYINKKRICPEGYQQMMPTPYFWNAKTKC